MLVLVCGDRNWSNFDLIKNRLSLLPKDSIIIEGEAPGADKLSRLAGEQLGFEVRGFSAEWNKYGRSAGPKRNIQMLDQNPDLVIACHNDLSKSRGTVHTVREARKRQIPIEIIKEKY